jgi:hypothetical protein
VQTSAFRSGQPGWQLFELARAGLTEATALGDSNEAQLAKMLLSRAVCSLLLRAELARAGVECRSASGDECWVMLTELPSASVMLAEFSTAERALIQSCLAASGDNHLANLTPEARARAATVLDTLVQRLSVPLGITPGKSRRYRPAWWLLAGAAMPCAVLGAWLVLAEPKQAETVAAEVKAAEPKAVDPKVAEPKPAEPAPAEPEERTNLALHRPVKVVTPDPVQAPDSSLLVDGDIKNLGFHSIDGQPNHVTIDLGKVATIREVVVYNRADCCQERAVPLRLEVSEDDIAYRRMGERTEVFDRWQAKFPKTKARYVRLTDLSNAYFHLAEVEVY